MRRIPYDLEDFRGLWTRCYACGNKSDSLPSDQIYLPFSTRNRPILLLEKRSSINTNGKEVRHTSDTGEGAERVLWTKSGYKEGGKSEGGKSASKRKSVLVLRSLRRIREVLICPLCVPCRRILLL